jgi:hypothetical protein
MLFPATPSAGRLIATGHDADQHCGRADAVTGAHEQCHFFEVAVNYVRAGAPDPVSITPLSISMCVEASIACFTYALERPPASNQSCFWTISKSAGRVPPPDGGFAFVVEACDLSQWPIG